jgi:hypothetical protein
MSSNSQSTYSYSSSSYSSSTSSRDGQRSGHAYAETAHSNPSGTTVNRRSQNLGEPVVEETSYYDAEGRPVQSVEGGGERGRIEDVTDEQPGYEERMGDEYAKREGGA